jgi:hypothetical protein
MNPIWRWFVILDPQKKKHFVSDSRSLSCYWKIHMVDGYHIGWVDLTLNQYTNVEVFHHVYPFVDHCPRVCPRVFHIFVNVLSGMDPTLNHNRI